MSTTTLPAVSARDPYQPLTIRNGAADEILTVNAAGADTIEGATSVTVMPLESITLQTDGTATWWIIQNYTPDKLSWNGQWHTGNTHFPNQIVSDDGWLAVANKETTDKPAPQPTGNPSWILDDSPIWTPGDITESFIISGNEYTFLKAGYFKGYRAWIPSTGSQLIYRLITIDRTIPSDPVTSMGSTFIPTATGWTTISMGQTIVVPGTVLEIGLAKQNLSSSTSFNGDWNYTTPNNWAAPTAGNIVHANKEMGMLSISKTDNIGGNRGAELLSIASGSQVQGAGMTWDVINRVNSTNYVDVNITPASQGSITGVSNFIFTNYGQQPLDWVGLPNYWDTNPYASAFSARGFYRLGDGTYIYSSDAFGTDVELQAAEVSEDWDLLVLGVA